MRKSNAFSLGMCSTVVAAVAGSALATNGITQIPLPTNPYNPDGGNSFKIGCATLSDDGQVLAGRDENGFSMLWTASGGAQSVPMAYANGISGNGQVVFGNDANSPAQANRWSRSSQSVESLGYLPATNPGSYGTAANTDGSVIGGSTFTNNGTRAFRWTSSGGMQDLGVLNPSGAYRQSEVYGMSGDGSVIAGFSTIGSGDVASHAFRWTSSGGMQDLGTLSGDVYSSANTVSKDGMAVIGRSTNTDGLNRAVRWTEGAGMVGLGELALGQSSDAYGANVDGSLIVGLAGVNDGTRAFIWSAAMGMVDLNSFLSQRQIDLGGVTFTAALAISADGSTILANGFTVQTLDDGFGGTYDQTINGSYLINLPAPGAAALVSLAGLMVRRRKA